MSIADCSRTASTEVCMLCIVCQEERDEEGEKGKEFTDPFGRFWLRLLSQKDAPWQESLASCRLITDDGSTVPWANPDLKASLVAWHNDQSRQGMWVTLGQRDETTYQSLVSKYCTTCNPTSAGE